MMFVTMINVDYVTWWWDDATYLQN